MITPEFKEIGDKFIAIKPDYSSIIFCGEIYTLKKINANGMDGVFAKDDFNYINVPMHKCDYFFKKYIENENNNLKKPKINFIKSYTIKINQKV
jgi:hypothetical protein